MITVNVGARGAAPRKALQIHHRPGYFTSTVPPPLAPKASLDDLLRNPLDGSAIGITAVTGSESGKYAVTVNVDLHDVHFNTENNRHKATVALSFADDASQHVQTVTVDRSYSDEEFAAALESGLSITQIFEEKSAVRICGPGGLDRFGGIFARCAGRQHGITVTTCCVT